MDDKNELSDGVYAFIELTRKYGDPAVQAEVDKHKTKWKRRRRSPERLMNLWVMVELAVYRWSKENRGKMKVAPAIKAMLDSKRSGLNFEDAIDLPQLKFDFTTPGGRDTGARTVRQRYYEAKRLMQKWKADGDKRFDWWNHSVELGKRSIDEGWTITFHDDGTFTFCSPTCVKVKACGWKRKLTPQI